MSFEFEGVNQFSAEVEQDSAVQQQQLPAHSVAEELDDLELDAIAGGCSDMADRARAAGIPVITTSGPRPNFFGRGPSMQLIEEASRAFGNRN